MTKEHYKNNPNDKQLDSVGRNIMSKFNKLKHRLKLLSIHSQVNSALLNTQIRADSNIKKVFVEMYPNEYRLALMEAMTRYGQTEKKEIRRDKIIKSLKLKDPNIIKKIFKGYNDTTI